MIEQELMKIWQSSPSQERIKFENSRLILEVQSNIDHLEKTIKYRDMRETAAVALVIPAFAVVAYTSPFLLSRIASVMVILMGIYVVFRLRKARKHKPGSYTETYLEYLYKTRNYLQVQKHLLDSVLYWYILPFQICLTLFFLGVYLGTENLRLFIQNEIVLTLVNSAIYVLNKKGAQKAIVPKLEKVEELISLMEKQ